MIVNQLEDYFRCPVCKNDLLKNKRTFRCEKCNIDYPLIEELPDFLPKDLHFSIKQKVILWNKLPYDYDQFLKKASSDKMNLIDLPLLRQCKIGMMVLEIGCGTARLHKQAEKKGCVYIGLDPSLILLNQARSNGATNLVRGVGEFLPFKDASFEVIIGGYVSFRYIQLEKLFAECFRVLKPEGILAFTLWNAWFMFLLEIKDNLKNITHRQQLFLPRLGIKGCNDVIWPWHLKKTLNQYGFKIIAILGTKKIPFMKKNISSNPYWNGFIGALFGYNLIFVCKKNP